MALNRIFSQRDTYLSQDNSYYYLEATQYDAAGRVTWRGLGANDLGSKPLLENANKYYAWSQEGGRLHVLHSGTHSNTTSLQNLVYDYDNVGNVSTILDYKTGNPQTQTFGYDTLNRLVSASATNGASGHGNYSETYTYNATTGNLASKTGIGNYTYSTNHPHAVESTGNGWSYDYDENGNQVQRVISDTYDLRYDAENRLVEVKKNSIVVATYKYNGDGERVSSTVAGVTTAYVSNYIEWSGSTLTRYYYAGAARLAMRKGSTLYFLFGDHLGSTSKSYRVSTGATTTLLYKAWGEARYSSGSLPTTYRFTGQREESSLGLYYYGARWYDPALGRFVQADTIIPQLGNPQAWDRYAYTYNNPLVFIDSDGNDPITVFLLLTIAVGCGIVARDIYSDLIHTPVINEPRVTSPTSTEMTIWLVNQIKSNSNSEVTNALSKKWQSINPANRLGAFKAWTAMVRTGGVWDFKVDINKQFPKVENIQLGGRTYNFQAVANIYYGFMGRSVGMSETLLRGGAGAFQKLDWGKSKNPNAVGPWYPPYYFDQRFDSYWIGFGMSLYDEYGDNLAALTEEKFDNFLDDYIGDHGAPPPLIIGNKR